MAAVRLPIWRLDLSLVDMVVILAFRAAGNRVNALAGMVLYRAARPRTRIAEGGGVAVAVRSVTGHPTVQYELLSLLSAPERGVSTSSSSILRVKPYR
jgi:hypothetical protein